MKFSRLFRLLVAVVILAVGVVWCYPFIFGYPQISLKHQSLFAAIDEANRREASNHDAPKLTRINFYGRVIDENSRPVEGVSVSFQWNGGLFYRTHHRETHSRTDGRFQLTGQLGDLLMVWLNKDGYYVPNAIKNAGFEFSSPGLESASRGIGRYYVETDGSHPFVFQIRRKHEPQGIIKKSIEIFPPADGTVASFDFMAGKLLAEGETGQMQIQTWKELREKFPWFPSDWRVTLIIPDGGFSAANAQEEFAFEAPLDGYASEMDWPLRAISAFDHSSIDKELYFCFGNPRRYGHLHISTRFSRRLIELQYVINPNPGDRNLEAYLDK